MNKKVEWDIIVPVKLPISLKNVEPGKLHPSLLRDIPQGGKLHYLAADAWNAMVDAAKKDGVENVFIYITLENTIEEINQNDLEIINSEFKEVEELTVAA